MADYHPLIARAVGGLDSNTGENRRALYERARAALVNQLRGVDPPLDEDEITRERLALEEAIRQVETEAVMHTETKVPQTVAAPAASSLRDQALRNFRDSVAEAEGLGEGAAEASRSARATYDNIPDSAPLPPPSAEAKPAAPAPHYFEPPAEEPPPPDLGEQPANPEQAASWPPAGASPPRPADQEEEEEDEFYKAPTRDWRRIVGIAVILIVVAAIAGGLYWKRQSIGAMVASLRSSQTATKPAAPAQPTGAPKITDRIGPSSNGQPAPANAPAAAVAQKVVLYEEDPSNPEGKRYVGSAIWRTETVSPGPGLAPELAIRADVEIPERRMRMTWSLRRNTDKALPASHTIEIMFSLPADFDQGGIANVPGVLMKTSEQARGVPLAGLAVKVTNGYFLIGLSAVDIDLQRNIEFLKSRDWFDIPIVYTNGKRAILAVEKGTPGSRAFEEAFRAWGQ
ncbi:MAG: hypothetical protein ACTHLO_12525 [Pseudolabrys sp.]